MTQWFTGFFFNSRFFLLFYIQVDHQKWEKVCHSFGQKLYRGKSEEVDHSCEQYIVNARWLIVIQETYAVCEIINGKTIRILSAWQTHHCNFFFHRCVFVCKRFFNVSLGFIRYLILMMKSCSREGIKIKRKNVDQTNSLVMIFDAFFCLNFESNI